VLLALDVGNTNTVLGVFKGRELVYHWRLATIKNRTVDEYGILIANLFSAQGLPRERIDAIVIACVVPPLMGALEGMSHKYFSLTPLVVRPGIKTGMPILSDNPSEVGADRIVNGVAAYNKYGGPTIVVDFGTATSFDAISLRGEYLGGVIAPGISISAEALFQETAKLPRVDIIKPVTVIGKNTITSMQSGLFYGYISMVEGIIKRMEKELGQPSFVVATGGWVELIGKEIKLIKKIDENLTLDGLRIIYERNQEQPSIKREDKTAKP